MRTDYQQTALNDAWRQLADGRDFAVIPSFPTHGGLMTSRSAAILTNETKEQVMIVGTEAYIRRQGDDEKWGIWELLP